MNDDATNELMRQAWLAGFGFAAFEREHGAEMLGTRDDAMRQDITDILEQAGKGELNDTLKLSNRLQKASMTKSQADAIAGGELQMV